MAPSSAGEAERWITAALPEAEHRFRLAHIYRGVLCLLLSLQARIPGRVRPSKATKQGDLALQPRLLVLGLFVCLIGFAGSVQAQRFSSVVVFGDSLSDSGNLAQFDPVRTTFGMLQIEGRQLSLPAGTSFTTNPDPVWSEIVAQTFGASGTNSLAGGSNHAWGAACVNRDDASCSVLSLPGADHAIPTTEEQIDQYLALSGGRAEPDTLYSMWGGGNDINGIAADLQSSALDAVSAAAAVANVAEAFVGQVRRLQEAGARHVLVFNLPDLGRTPYALAQTEPGRAAALSLLSGTYNQEIAARLSSLEIGIVPINVAVLTNEIFEDPETYGFTNVVGKACPPTGIPGLEVGDSIVCGPTDSGYGFPPHADETYFFADGLHPSGAAHAIVANVVTSTLAAPVQVSLAGEGGVEVAEAHRDAVSVERMSELGLDRPVGSWRGYVSARVGGRYELDALPRLGETQADVKVLTMGANYRAGSDFFWGAAWSLGLHVNDVSGARLDSTAVSGSLHGTWLHGGLYLSGILSGGRTSVDIERSISLGPGKRVERGSTSTNQLGAEIELGWILAESEGHRHDLFVGLGWLDQRIDGYRERGSSSTSMNFSEFDRDSHVVRAGYQFMRGQGLGGMARPYVRIAYESELSDEPVSVTAGSNTMPGRFTLSGLASPRRWVSAEIGLTASVGEQGSVFTSYSGRFGSESRRDHGLSFGLRVSF